MNSTYLDHIKQALPNMPDELAEEWLVPYVEELGPPISTGRWRDILAGRSLDFWHNVSWELELVNLTRAILIYDCEVALIGMYKAYFCGEMNPYSEIRDGRARTERTLTYLKKHRVFPVPPAFLQNDNGQLEIIDGNHRMLAFRLAMKISPPMAEVTQRLWIGVQRASISG